MIIEVKVPSVGESVTSGVVSAWHKKSGEFVNEGEPLFALETDKVSTDIVAEKSGMLETRVREGQEVTIGEVIATIDDSKQQATEQKRQEQVPEKKAVEETKKNREPEKQPPSVASVDRSRAESSSSVAPELSPAVRRILEEEKLNPAMVAATGPANRLTKADVLKAVEERGKAKPVAEPVAKPIG